MPSRSNWNSAGRIGRGSCGTIEVNRSRSTSIWASSLWMQTMVFGVRRSSSARMWSMWPVREQNQAQRRLLLEQRVLDDQQIPARVDDGGRAACAVLEDVAVCIQPADHKAGDDIIDHMRLLLPSENGSLP